MLTLKKMMSIIHEKDSEKRAAMIDALPEKDKAELEKTTQELYEYAQKNFHGKK